MSVAFLRFSYLEKLLKGEYPNAVLRCDGTPVAAQQWYHLGWSPAGTASPALQQARGVTLDRLGTLSLHVSPSSVNEDTSLALNVVKSL